MLNCSERMLFIPFASLPEAQFLRINIMNTLLLIALIATITSVRGGVTNLHQQRDFEAANPYQGWSTVEFNGQEQQGHDVNLAAQAHAQEATLWKAKELAKAKALADHHANLAALKVKAAAEEQSKALAFQAATKAKVAADQEAEQAILKANEAAQEEYRALTAAQEAELVGKQASFAALDARNAADELNKSYLVAKARAEEEANNAAGKAKAADAMKEQVAAATRARLAAEEVARVAAQKAKSAEEAFWKAKHSAWTW